MPSLHPGRSPVLVTGANGFLGSEIVRQCVSAGRVVRGTDRHEGSHLRGADYFPADILQSASLRTAMDGVECVIHAAGLAHVFGKTCPAVNGFHAVNEVGTANVAEAAILAGVRHIILISSVSVYGAVAHGVDERAACHPMGPYAESKWQAEQRALEGARASGIELSILRLATLYGEGDPGNVARLMRLIDRGRFVWVGDGSNRKSLLHREDAARACLAVMGPGREVIDVFNVCGSLCTMRDVVACLAAALGRRIPGWYIPGSLAAMTTGVLATLSSGRMQALHTTMQKWLADDSYDASKFERTCEWRARVSLDEGVRREVAWYRGITPQS